MLRAPAVTRPVPPPLRSLARALSASCGAGAGAALPDVRVHASVSSAAPPGTRLDDLRRRLRDEGAVAGTGTSANADADADADTDPHAPEVVHIDPTLPGLPRASRQLKKPAWLRITPTEGTQLANYERLKATVKELKLATVCESAKCPNIAECWGGGEDHKATATIMIGGEVCTRACRFCSVKTSLRPPPLDPGEPERVAEAIARWGLDYVVITSVDRDDVEDHGASHFAETVRRLKSKSGVLVEFLTPDFGGVASRVELVARSGVDVYAHNLETVERLQSQVRDRRANYAQSLSVLEAARRAVPGVVTKTSLMLGLGETVPEVRQTMRDALAAGVQVITFGQYARPTKGHLPVKEYVTPETFDALREEGERMGFRYVASGPLVRSSYKAGELFLKAMVEEQRRAGASSSAQGSASSGSASAPVSASAR